LELVPAVARRADYGGFESKVDWRNGRVFYRDNFVDPNSGWPDRFSAKYSREGYQLSGENVVVVNGPLFKNFRAAVSLTTDGSAGLVFRQNERGYYAFALSHHVASVNRVEAIRTTELARWAVNTTAGGAQKIEVRCDGSDCSFYQGEVLLGRVQDSGFSEGRIGLQLSGRGNAVFNDLTVEETR
jgi:hypothetical protein